LAARELKVWAIVTAGGVGRRMGAGVAKQFLKVSGKPILTITLENLSSWGGFAGFVVTAPEADIDATYEAVSTVSGVKVVAGGETRQDSVLRGLEALSDAAPEDIVFIHDGVRPYPPLELFDKMVKLAAPEGAILASPATDTVKAVDGSIIEGTLDRERLFFAQTPQAFPYGYILETHRDAKTRGVIATDDASLSEERGGRVNVIPSLPGNIKVTTPEDLKMVRLKERVAEIRMGHGYDVHRLVSGRALTIGGVVIEHEKGLLGHSDADVATHAVADAILGAAALGDIGKHFPDTDPGFKGADSLMLLREVAGIVAAEGYGVANVDITIVAQRPKLAPHIPKMREKLAAALQIGVERVSVKATTTEGLGFEGREEGISAHAVALLEAK